MAKNKRTTVYNKMVTEEKLARVNSENTEIGQDFLSYLRSIDRSQTTIEAYAHDLSFFWCWNLEYNKNKPFVSISKREFARFQEFGISECGWSPSRVRRIKSTLSSLSNYISDICDDIYEGYRPVVRKIADPVNTPVREKTILTDDEVDELLDVLVEDKKYRVACAVALAAYSGARKSELLRFKVDYFTEDNIMFNAIYKTREKIRTKGRGGTVGKPLYKYTLIGFKRYLDLWLKERERLGIDSEWLFVTHENGEWVQAKISTMDSYASICNEYLDKPFYFHCLRHQLCSRLARYNLPAKVIQEYFGWASQDLISVYDDNDAADDFGKYFTPDGIVAQRDGALENVH